MGSLIKRYVKNPDPIEAVLVTRANLDEVAVWCGGDTVEISKPGDPTDVYYGINVPSLSGTIRVGVGKYLIKNQLGKFRPLQKEAFENEYKESGVREPDWGHHDQPYPKVVPIKSTFANQRDRDL